MEYRDYYCGDMTVPAEKRAEFTERVLKIMDQGGLMGLEKVQLCGRELRLLTLPSVDAGNNVCVNFSYFEYEKYDEVHYNADTARMSCGYIDLREFFSATIATWLLREFYTGSFGMAHYEGTSMPLIRTIAWLNYLFRTSYTAARTRDIWKVYQLFPTDIRKVRNYTNLLDACSSTLGTLKYVVCAQKECGPLDTCKYADIQKQMFSLYPVMDTAHSLDAIMHTGEESPEEKLDTVKTILTTPAPERYAVDDRESCVRFARLSEQLPGEVSIKMLSEAFDVEYEALMEEIGEAACAASHPEEKHDHMYPPVPAMSTTEFFRCDNDDRVYWWSEEGDVTFSDAMESWLKELGEEYEAILHTHTLIGMGGEAALCRLTEELHRTGSVFGKLYCFRDFFYEFLVHAAAPRYHASILLLGRLIDRLGAELPRPDREGTLSYLEIKNSLPLRKMKRYLALLANKELRCKVFGF